MEYVLKGKKVCVISYGPEINRIQKLIEDHQLNLTLVNARFIRPIDEEILEELLNTYKKIVVIEQVIQRGSLYQDIATFANQREYNSKIESISFANNVILTHGKISDVLNHYGFSDEDILKKIRVD